MPDIDAYISAGALADLEPAVADRFQAASAAASLVTNLEGYRNQTKPQSRRGSTCERGYYVQIYSPDHSVWVWVWKPCDKWDCSSCGYKRVQREMVPEIARAFKWARSEGVTLKFLTQTWQARDQGAMASEDGAKQRRQDQSKLARYIRRDRGEIYEYMRIEEYHKSGRIHFHNLAVMPYIRQSELSEKWATFARGSFRIDVEAVGWKCPRCWPGPKAPRKEKRRSMIIPPPGRGECLCCGFEPDWDSQETWDAAARAIAVEMSKYLTKDLVKGKEGELRKYIKKITRSRGWAGHVQEGVEEVATDLELAGNQVPWRTSLKKKWVGQKKNGDRRQILVPSRSYMRSPSRKVNVLGASTELGINFHYVAGRPKYRKWIEPPPVCECCGQVHGVRSVQKLETEAGFEPYLAWAAEKEVAFHAQGHGPCNCFTGVIWYEGGVVPEDKNPDIVGLTSIPEPDWEALSQQSFLATVEMSWKH